VHRFKYFARIVFRFVILWLVDVFSLWVTSLIVPRIAIESVNETPIFVVAGAAALMLGMVNLIVRPLILLLALPFGFFALLVVGLFVNAIAMYITAALLPGFMVGGWVEAFFGGLMLSLVNTMITGVLTIDDDDQFYQGLVERIAARQTFRQSGLNGHGLVMLEIDGLSYWHFKKAIAEDWMPTVKEMITNQGYQISQVDCGLPSQTSACQAGILYGDNYDIPAFRWYDKTEGRLIVSGKDAAMINQRFANGHGLLRGGSSINNMLSGDAEKSLLTLANLTGGTSEEQRRRAQDMYLLLLNPYFLMRTLVLFIGDVLLELFQYLRARLRGEWPRLNRLMHFYPVLRASTTVLLRDVAAYLLVLDIIRGSPSIYVTLAGYDEVAHHSGPWSRDAYGVLRKIDQVIARVRDMIARKAPISYDLILLSDHGQSFGPTFQQRYGVSLHEFISAHTPEDVQVMLTSGGDDGSLSVRAMSGEIENIQQQGVGGRVGQSVARQTNRVLTKGTAHQDLQDALETASVIVCSSGNLAQVYFDLLPRRLSLAEINTAYPGLVDALVGHEGVGFVVAYEAGGAPIALGKRGRRDLHTGQVVGEDPLIPYGDIELRAEQVQRIADFPNAGDLIVNSTLYADGTVAAMEELIGSHGGLGGEQTDAFIFHPQDLHVPPTRNATDIYRVLDNRRRQPLPAGGMETQVVKPRVDEWSPQVLREGLFRYDTWLTLAAHALWLRRGAYQAVVDDPYMTSPALLIALVMAVIGAVLDSTGTIGAQLLIRLSLWPLLVLILFGAARVLGGKGTYTQTLRAMGFSQVGGLFQLLVLLPVLAPIAWLASFAFIFIGTWIGVNEAHKLRGWRVWIIPIAALVLLVLGVVVIGLLFSGVTFTVTSLLGEWLGLSFGR
jgi:uncharacterized membrane protein YvlD (DUF360 family)